jgi:hypothetical protein
MEEFHSSKPIAERDLSVDNNKIQFVILNDQPIDNSRPVLYLTKLNPDLRTNLNDMEESKEDAQSVNCNATWSSRKIDLSILYRDNSHSELGPKPTDNFHRVSYPSDEYGEEKVTYSPDPAIPECISFNTTKCS